MDPILVANLKVARGSSVPAASERAERRTFARTELSKQRQKRGQLLFLDRMEADATSQRAFSHVCTLRQHREHRDALDRAVDSMRPKAQQPGPRVVSHSSKILFEGHDRKMNWAPLEFY
mmetsp:Transcript_78225/g.176778  ORF Transcript_78225/g.176778 Transcript_78225/m.176778 type:complete len:119 (-) Transcript_78225:154-510(-)